MFDQQNKTENKMIWIWNDKCLNTIHSNSIVTKTKWKQSFLLIDWLIKSNWWFDLGISIFFLLHILFLLIICHLSLKKQKKKQVMRISIYVMALDFDWLIRHKTEHVFLSNCFLYITLPVVSIIREVWLPLSSFVKIFSMQQQMHICYDDDAINQEKKCNVQHTYKMSHRDHQME